MLSNYHNEVISKYPADTWVKPTNNGCNDFDVFADLFEYSFAERKIEDHYRGKTHIGSTHYFRYSNNA